MLRPEDEQAGQVKLLIRPQPEDSEIKGFSILVSEIRDFATREQGLLVLN